MPSVIYTLRLTSCLYLQQSGAWNNESLLIIMLFLCQLVNANDGLFSLLKPSLKIYSLSSSKPELSKYKISKCIAKYILIIFKSVVLSSMVYFVMLSGSRIALCLWRNGVKCRGGGRIGTFSGGHGK